MCTVESTCLKRREIITVQNERLIVESVFDAGRDSGIEIGHSAIGSGLEPRLSIRRFHKEQQTTAPKIVVHLSNPSSSRRLSEVCLLACLLSCLTGGPENVPPVEL